MQNSYFDTGYARVGEQDVPFVKTVVQNRFSMYVPESFQEDTSLAYRYTYLSNRGKSPLGIALRFAAVSSKQAREKMRVNYLGPEEDCSYTSGQDGSFILYHETLNKGEKLSIYSLRFSVDMADGLLLGCFNTLADYRDDWKEVVLHMLESMEEKND